jgi:hypothetical protein
VLSRAWSLAFTRRSWCSSNKSCGVNWISKVSAIALAWIAVGALCPSLLRRDFAMGHIASGVTSELLIFVLHRF